MKPGNKSAPNTAGTAAWVCLVLAWAAFVSPHPAFGVFFGWPLNAIGFILAIVAMVKHGTHAGLRQLLGSLIASPPIYLYGFAIFPDGAFAA
jgi:hypothetical protein